MNTFPLGNTRSPNTLLALGAGELLIALAVVTALMLGVGQALLGNGVILVALAVVPLCILGVRHWNDGHAARIEEAEFQDYLNRDTIAGE